MRLMWRTRAVFSASGPTLEVGQVALGDGHRFGLVVDGHVHHTVGRLHRHGPDLVGLVHPEATALDHGRPPHADVGVGGGNHHIATTEDGGVAGEAVAGVDPDERH